MEHNDQNNEELLKYDTKESEYLRDQARNIYAFPTGVLETPHNYTEIKKYEYKGCENLTTVTIPDSVTKIGAGAFYGCSNLTTVTIPDSVTEIGSDAFNGCSNLKYITIPNRVTKIGSRVFYGCENLTTVTIPDSVTEIGSDAFNGCSNLATITIPNRVTKIGSDAFNGCSNLATITIPDSVTKIGSRVFYGCSNLATVTIPESVTEIGSDAFFGCSNLKEITIPDSVTEIGSDAFFGCSNLKEIIIPDSVTKIGSGAFLGCGNLRMITIPDSVTEIGSLTFRGCSNLRMIKIPDSVTKIGAGAFYGCSNLKTITIPDSVTEIGVGAFYGCDQDGLTINIVIDYETSNNMINILDYLKQLSVDKKIQYQFSNKNYLEFINLLNKYLKTLTIEEVKKITYDKSILKNNIELLIGCGIDEEIILGLLSRYKDNIFHYSLTNNFKENYQYLVRQKTLVSSKELEIILFSMDSQIDINNEEKLNNFLKENITDSNCELLFSTLFKIPDDKNQLETRNRFVVCHTQFSNMMDNIKKVRSILMRDSFNNIIDYDTNRYQNEFGIINQYENLFNYEVDGIKVFDGIKYVLAKELSKINPNILKDLNQNPRLKSFLDSLNTIKNWNKYGDRKKQATTLKNEFVARVLYSIIRTNLDNDSIPYDDSPSSMYQIRQSLSEYYNPKSNRNLNYNVDLNLDYLCHDFSMAAGDENQQTNKDCCIVYYMISKENPYLFDIYRGYGMLNDGLYQTAAKNGYYFDPNELRFDYPSDNYIELMARAIINDIGMPTIPDDGEYIEKLNSLIDQYFTSNENDLLNIFRGLDVFLRKNRIYDLQDIENDECARLNKDIFDDDSKYNDYDRLQYCLYYYNRLAHSISEIDMKAISIESMMYGSNGFRVQNASNGLSYYKRLQNMGFEVDFINKLLESAQMRKTVSIESQITDIYEYVKKRISIEPEDEETLIKYIAKAYNDTINNKVYNNENENPINNIAALSNASSLNIQEIIRNTINQHIEKMMEGLQWNANTEEQNDRINNLSDEERMDILKCLSKLNLIDKDLRSKLSSFSKEQILFFNTKRIIAERLLKKVCEYFEASSITDLATSASDQVAFFKANGYVVEQQDGGTCNVLVCYNPKFMTPFSIHMPGNHTEVGEQTITHTKVPDGLKPRKKLEIKPLSSNSQNIASISAKEDGRIKIEQLPECRFLEIPTAETSQFIPIITYANFFKYDVEIVKERISTFCMEKHSYEECERFINIVDDFLPFTNPNDVYVEENGEELSVLQKYRKCIGYDELIAYRNKLLFFQSGDSNEDSAQTRIVAV